MKTSKLRIVYEPVEKLKPSNYNPRTISEKDLKSLVKNMSEFGHLGILIANRKTNNLISGHQRLKVAKLLKMKEIAVVWIDVSLRKEKILNIGMNKISGEWDMPMLKDLLEEVDNGEGDMDMTGFDEVEIEMLMTEFHQDEIEEDEVPEPPEEPITKTGDLWLLGEHRVLCEDNANAMKQLKDEEFDLVLTDPPYGIGIAKNGTVGGENLTSVKNYGNCEWDNDIPNKNVFDEIRRISKNQIIFGGNYFVEHLKNSPCWIVWDKDNTGNFADCELAWTSFKTAVRKFKYTWNGMIQEDMKNKEYRYHPTQKPVALMAWILTNYSEEKHTVLDPFLGSGTTLIAAEQLGRKCFGIEISPQYVDVTIKRWENLTGKKAKLSN